MTVWDRADGLLRYLNKNSIRLGDVTRFYALDNTSNLTTAEELLAWTASEEISEIRTLAEYIDGEGWAKFKSTPRSGSSGNDLLELMLLPLGYKRLAELDGANSDSSQGFVAMWFDSSMAEVYEKGIEPAIRDSGYKPIRIDKMEHANNIDDEIIAGIRRSRFVVADFTSEPDKPCGGVYFEAGFALGLNIPVIWSCRANMIDKVHFDTRQYNHITWETPEELRDKLNKRISAIIGDGSYKAI